MLRNWWFYCTFLTYSLKIWILFGVKSYFISRLIYLLRKNHYLSRQYSLISLNFCKRSCSRRTLELVGEAHQEPDSADLPSSSKSISYFLLRPLTIKIFLDYSSIILSFATWLWWNALSACGRRRSKGLTPVVEAKILAGKFNEVARSAPEPRWAWLELRGPRRRYYGSSIFSAPPFMEGNKSPLAIQIRHYANSSAATFFHWTCLKHPPPIHNVGRASFWTAASENWIFSFIIN